jgi:hypothetical protein
MGLVEHIRGRVAEITSDLDGFGVAISFASPTGEKIDVVGTQKKIGLKVDLVSGETTNTTNASVSVSESFFVEKNYPHRDLDGNVTLKDHHVTLKFTSGDEEYYIVEQAYPDETVGLIVCILGQYVQD